MLHCHMDDNLEWVGPVADRTFMCYGTMDICGVPHHVEGFRLRFNDQGVQVPDTLEGLDYRRGDLVPGQVRDAVEDDGPWLTVAIDGGEYCLIVTPYSSYAWG